MTEMHLGCLHLQEVIAVSIDPRTFQSVDQQGNQLVKVIS